MADTIKFENGTKVQVEEGWEGVVVDHSKGWVSVKADADGEVLKFRADTLAVVADAKPKKIAKQPTECECGCGELANKRYRQGHDARHKGALLREARAGNEDAMAELEKRGWSKFLVTKRMEREATKAAEAA